MKVICVLRLYIVAIVFLCIIKIGISATKNPRRSTTSSPKATPAYATEVNKRRSRRPNTTVAFINTTPGLAARNLGSSKTGVSRPSPPPLEANGSRTIDTKRTDSKTRRKSTTPKKYTSEQKKSFVEDVFVSGPTKVDLPQPIFQNEKRSPKNPRNRTNCPRENEVKFDLFPIKCNRDKDCRSWNSSQICCEIFGAKSCVVGIPKPLEESTHSPIFGIIPRRCPQQPLAELWWDVKVCDTDADCWPRVCCPDGQKRYCRTSQPELDIVPVPVKRSLNYLSEYLQCTPPPPPIFDLHPKSCNSTFDCFPNVCCQEAGKKHCRPPKKSVLTLLANFLNLGLVKRLTKNLVIK